MRTKARITVTVPKGLLEIVEADIAAGKATSVSAWVSEAMEAKAGPRTIAQIIDDLAESWGDGPLTEEELAWARNRLGR